MENTIEQYEKPDSESESSDDDGDGDESPDKLITHYSSKHRILFVGDGDFSFSLCLARAFGSAFNMVATTIDSQEKIEKNYSNGVANVRELEERGCLVLFGVDAKQMSQHFFLRTQRLNKRLIKGFLSNAKVLLKENNGEIHVTHKEGDPYDKWDLVKKANKIGLDMHLSVPFSKNDYPGYQNKRAHGTLSDDSFPLGDCTTYKFKLNSP